MPPLNWAAFALGAAVIVVYVLRWYRAREEPVRGRLIAAVLRAAALILVLLVALNPALPAGWEPIGDREARLLDASHSMSRSASPSGPTLWRLARDSLAGDGDLWLFGGPAPLRISVDSLPDGPVETGSRLAAAVRAAGLSGARRARVITDGRISDAAEAMREARRHGLALSFTTLDGEHEEAGIARATAPSWVQAGDSAFVTVELVATGIGGDTLRVEVADHDGEVVAAGRTPMPDAGRYESIRLGFRAPEAAGLYRYTVELQKADTDPEPRDNRRPFYLRVSEDPDGAVLISLRPDWEPSFLAPNLDRLTDVPGAAYLWLQDSLIDAESYRATPLEVVARQARAAPLLVLHGYDARAPAWARELARTARRLLVFAAGDRGFELPDGGGGGIEIGPPLAGEWYASPEIPRTPIALDLVGFAEAELPPLVRPREVTAPRSWAPLNLRRGRRGEPLPALVAGSVGGRRWAVATAEGYWRWAFRSGDGRQLYRTLWTGVAGWLLEDGGGAGAAAGLEPLRRVVERGQPLRWSSPGSLDSLRVELWQSEGARPADTSAVSIVSAAGGDTVMRVAPPGRYRFRATAFREGRAGTSASGPVEVEEFSHELLPRPLAELESLAADSGADAPSLAAGRSRRLASWGWVYLALIVLFCAEWGVRRFIGLR